ncbi:MAG TPA: hypothetical protein VNS09_26325 [Solirubrobacter sp.]|nr:hypothetical protein [Solirubrobacter sp.]
MRRVASHGADRAGAPTASHDPQSFASVPVTVLRGEPRHHRVRGISPAPARPGAHVGLSVQAPDRSCSYVSLTRLLGRENGASEKRLLVVEAAFRRAAERRGGADHVASLYELTNDCDAVARVGSLQLPNQDDRTPPQATFLR